MHTSTKLEYEFTEKTGCVPNGNSGRGYYGMCKKKITHYNSFGNGGVMFSVTNTSYMYIWIKKNRI